ncbi:MAG: alpha/beta hydrolase [candidate division KSB1 bacterium]|nr:alpha/beta hydrolase [candidate division KSB1 bacterium]MDZ7303815.1 alpha/beta hydrolase [candidate division KSB1 bacterium]MDZ7314174.1 alpha/beta hydrolase [candidate division KSB1 bacterium]
MLRFLIITIAALAAVFLLMRLLERQMVFFPSKYPTGFWQARHSSLEITDIWFLTTDGLKLHGWLVPHSQPIATLLMCHGNAGNVSDRHEWVEMLHKQVPANIFIFDYRGYGRSEGTPTEEGCYLDAVAAFNWLAAQKPALPIIVHGHSLGSAVAVELVRRLPEGTVAGLILESSFTNAADMARLMFGPIPLHWLTSMKWASTEKIGDLKIPKLFIHGQFDSVIPIRLGQKLFAVAAPPKEFVVLARADHNDTFMAGGDEYYRAIRDFVARSISSVTSDEGQSAQ